MKSFDLEYQYQLYLQKMKLDENLMTLTQKVETKRAFFGACAQLLFLFRDELSKLQENEAIIILDRMKNQIANYFLEQNHKKN